MKKYKNKVKEAREKKGLSQADLAEAVNDYQPNISLTESGDRVPGLYRGIIISEFLGVPVRELFYEYFAEKDKEYMEDIKE